MWTAIIDPTLVGTEEYIAQAPFSLENSFPNPFKESAWISFKIYKQAPVTLAVYDQLGRPVEVMLDHLVLQPGKYTYQFDAERHNLASGVYYFSLVSNDRVIRQKIILNR
jgi:serine protease AprX